MPLADRRAGAQWVWGEPRFSEEFSEDCHSLIRRVWNRLPLERVWTPTRTSQNKRGDFAQKHGPRLAKAATEGNVFYPPGRLDIDRAEGLVWDWLLEWVGPQRGEGNRWQRNNFDWPGFYIVTHRELYELVQRAWCDWVLGLMSPPPG